VLSLPAGIGVANFCSFVGAFLTRIQELRVVRRESGRGSCMVLLQFKDAKTADSFYANYNDRPVGLCHMVAHLS
jgi:BRCA1-associated protein